MRHLLTHALIVFTMMWYISSLFQILTPSEEGDIDLRVAIQQIQKIHNASVSDQINFPEAVRGSIDSLRAIAGIKAVIIKKSAIDETNQPTILVVLTTSPHIQSTYTYPIDFRASVRDNFPTEKQRYISINFPPDTPPPNPSTSRT